MTGNDAQKEKKNTKSYSQNKAVRHGWGNRPNFQASFGLKMTDEDIQEGKEILKAMVKADNQTKQK